MSLSFRICLLGIWLAAAAGQCADGFTRRDLVLPPSGDPGFTRLAADTTGIVFSNQVAEVTAANNRILENGSGTALGDIDGDGLCDIYLCRLEGPNALYRNRGDWKFEDITARSGVACDGQYSTGAVFADVDGDGDLDLLVNAIGGGTRLFLNDGHGVFQESTIGRLDRRLGATSLALADMDGDGDLDLYVTNYRTTTYRDRPPDLKVEAQMVNGRIVVTPENRFIPIVPRGAAVEVIEQGERDFLYINTGQARFAPVLWSGGAFVDEKGQPLTAPTVDWGLSVMFRDANHDGHPDLYICNDFFYFPDRFWLSQHSRSFRAAAPFAIREVSLSAMAVDFADINRDGFDDFVVVDMLSRDHAARHRQRPEIMKGTVVQPYEEMEFRQEVTRNTLFLSRGDGTWAEIAHLAGLDATEWSWGALFLDVDLDGFEDLIIPTGNLHDVQDADVMREQARRREPSTPEVRLRNWRNFPRLATPILAYRNRADLTFEERTAAWGLAGDGVAHGAALADLDNDGDLDLVVNRLGDAVGVYRNNSSAPRVAVRLRGSAPNTRGIGAKIRVFAGSLPSQTQEMICGGRYLSGDDTLRVFAAGNASNSLRIEVTWRDGRRSTLDNVRANSLCEIHQEAAAPAPPDAASAPKPDPWFEDVSSALAHRHYDDPFDDFAQQPLLSRRLSRLGPGIAWVDLDGDQHDDLVIGAGRGGQMAVFHNLGQGALVRTNWFASATPWVQDQAGLAAWHNDGRTLLAIGLAPDARSVAGQDAVLLLDRRNGSRSSVLPYSDAGMGPVVAADVDLDGDLDLFAGGRLEPGGYPRPPVSKLLRWAQRRFSESDADREVFANVGMVSGAVFTDIDGDGDSDLVLACEWGPLRLFRNHQGRFTEITESAGLSSFTGWWNGVTAADFDGDGRMDLVASNWGRNTRYQKFLAKPLRLYYGDFDGNGVVDLFEAEFIPGPDRYMPWRTLDVVSAAIPALAERFPTYRAYGQASIEDVLGAWASQAQVLAAATLDNTLFLNRGERFQIRPLPVEAQFSPAFGIVAGDFDGDGNEDLFLAQNFFGVEQESSRHTAGRGLLLQGDGRGGLAPLAGPASGIIIHGEQRGCAVADFDQDGRLDLAVGQARAETKLFRNRAAKPGLRVRLSGPPGNPHAVGAMVRIIGEDWTSLAREVRAGSGYWSQDSPTLLFGCSQPAKRVWVRWPGGRESTHPVAPGAAIVTVPAPP